MENMMSKKQIEANRRNARKSTGPRTPEGKAKSSLNPLKHGMTAAKNGLLPDEDPIAYATLRMDIQAEYQDRDGSVRELVRRLSDLFWQARRIPACRGSLLVQNYLQQSMDTINQQTSKATAKSAWPHKTDPDDSDPNRNTQLLAWCEMEERSLSTSGFLTDLLGDNLMELIDRYDRALAKEISRVMAELERWRIRPVEGDPVK
jgi:hypothetical protein